MKFSGVWPTYLLRRQLPEFEQPTDSLAAHIADWEKRETDLTARFHEQRFFQSAHSGVRWLKDRIEETATAYLRQMGLQQVPPWSLMGWYNTNRYGDHHAPHTHPGAYLSGTYYVRVPPGPEAPNDAGARSGCISFYDPRTGANMVTAGGEPDARAAHVIRPGAGTLLMWPSPLQHSVHPNLSEAPRVSISFNLNPVKVRRN
jgi:uncharacterized protein (TIGR02466 family)